VLLGIYDLLTLGVLVLGYAMGRSRGFAWQVSGLITLVVGGLCATVLSRPLAGPLGGGLLGRFAAWVLLYAAVAVCLYVLTLKFKHKLEELEYDELDRRFGGALGATKAVAMFGIVTLVAVSLSPRVEAAVKRSLAGRALRSIVHELRPLWPEKIYEAFGPYLEDPQEDPVPEQEPASTSASTDPPALEPPTVTDPAPPPPGIDPQPFREPVDTTPPQQPIAEPVRSTQPPPPRRDPAPPPRRDPPPADPPAVDPFDTSQDPPDPLAPR
jgi:uncharacterized membrane protein required for colicin V production